MRKLYALSFAALLAAFTLLAACKADDGETRSGANNTASVAKKDAPVESNGNSVAAGDARAGAQQDVRRVSIDELRAMLERDEAIVVDVRSKPSYDSGHIKGSISIPREEVRQRAGELPKDKLVVFYCA